MYRVGDSYSKKYVATEKIIREIANVSGDRNPIHLNEEAAQRSVFGRRIAHGLFCLNYISAIIGNYFPGNGSILIAQSFQYKKPVYIGDEIKITITIKEIINEKDIYILDIACVNQDGKIVLLGDTSVKKEVFDA